MDNKNDINTHPVGNLSASLPMSAIKEIPVANTDAKTIVGLKKEGGLVVGYKLSDGQVVDKDAAVSLARSGGIVGVGISTRDGNEYLKSLPDGTEDNNLSHLPTV